MNKQNKSQKKISRTLTFMLVLSFVTLMGTGFVEGKTIVEFEKPLSPHKIVEGKQVKDYGKYILKEREWFDIFGWAENTALEIELHYNTDKCFLNCESRGTAQLYKEEVLFQEFNFKDKNSKDYQMKEFNVYLFDGYELKEREVCLEYEENKTENSKGNYGSDEFYIEPKCKTKEIEKYQEEIWKPYNFEILPVGEYRWKITGSKHELKDKVDWIATTMDKELSEWIWWNNAPAKYVYVGGSNRIIKKYLASDFSLIATSPNYGGDILGIALDDDYVYYVGATTNTVRKAFKSNLSTITDSPSYGTNIVVISLDYNYVYYGGSSNIIRKAFKSNLSTITDSPSYGAIIQSIALDYNYVYYGGSSNIIRKAFKSNLSTITDSPSYGGNILSIALDDNYIYYGGSTTRTVRKAFKSNLSTITNSPNYGGDIRSIALDDNYIYYGGSTTRTVRKAFKSNLSTITNSPNYGGDIIGISLDDDYVYYGGETTRTVRKAFKSNLSTITNSPNYGGDIYSLLLDYLFTGIQIIPNFPPDNYLTKETNINFNFTIIPLYLDLVNITIDVNDTSYTQSLSGNETIDYIFPLTLSEGSYIWNATACGEDENEDVYCDTTNNFNLEIDTTAPVLTPIYPPTNNYKDYVNLANYSYFPYGNFQLEWNVSDPSLDKCWYENISLDQVRTNISISCVNPIIAPLTILFTTTTTLRMYANDSLGNLGSLVITGFMLGYKINEQQTTYNPIVMEELPRDFYTNIYVNPLFTIKNVSFEYNGTNYSADYNSLTHFVTLSKLNFNIPDVNADTNITWTWWVNLSDNSVINLTSHVQTIKEISFSPGWLDQCNATYPYSLFNLFLKDEETENAINGTMEIDILVRTPDQSLIIHSWNFEKITNRTALCSSSLIVPGTDYRIDGTVKYFSPNHAIEYYEIRNYTLGSNHTTQNISLYDLILTDATDFQITFNGFNFLPAPGVILYLERQYLSQGVFKVVEAPITDSNGQTILHMVRNNVYYNIKAVKDGKVMGVYQNIRAFCQESLGTCSMILNAKDEEIFTPNYPSVMGTDVYLLRDPTFNSTTQTATASFVSPTSQQNNITLIVSRNDIFGNDTLCETSIIAVSGTISCTLDPIFAETSVITSVYVNGILLSSKSTESEDRGFGTIGYLAWFIFTLIFILIFADSKTLVIIGLLISYVGATILGFSLGSIVGLGAGLGSAGIWIIAITMVAIYQLNKNRLQ